MLQGALPTEEIVKAMLDKITAEEKLNVKAASKNVDKKVVVTKGYMMDPSSPATSPSEGSWDPILDSPDRRQLEDFLTEQEKTDLRNLVLSRKNMASQDVNQPEELTEALLVHCNGLQFKLSLNFVQGATSSSPKSSKVW